LIRRGTWASKQLLASLRDAATCTNGAGYTPAVCVSFTIPKPGLGKLRVCLEN
jgi:hypothetical protein